MQSRSLCTLDAQGCRECGDLFELVDQSLQLRLLLLPPILKLTIALCTRARIEWGQSVSRERCDTTRAIGCSGQPYLKRALLVEEVVVQIAQALLKLFDDELQRSVRENVSATTRGHMEQGNGVHARDPCVWRNVARCADPSARARAPSSGTQSRLPCTSRDSRSCG
jgi:hypothetical protein